MTMTINNNKTWIQTSFISKPSIDSNTRFKKLMAKRNQDIVDHLQMYSLKTGKSLLQIAKLIPISATKIYSLLKNPSMTDYTKRRICYFLNQVLPDD